MKKLTFVLLMSVLFTTVNAQELVSKNGDPVLPEAGDFALGFDAVPFLRYFGNFFNGTSNNSVGANFVSNNSGLQIYGKYFLAENNAVRARVRINNNFDQRINRVLQDGQTAPQPNIEVEDQMLSNSFTLELGGGMEWRRGKGRLFGVYGAEALVSLNTYHESYTYGNEFSMGNQTPTTTTNFFANTSAIRASRVVEVTSPNSFGVGARGFVGVEYFFAPKISIGAEFYIGVSYMGTNRSEVISEEWEPNSGTVIQIKNVDGGNLTQFDVTTANYGGAINLLFHF